MIFDRVYKSFGAKAVLRDFSHSFPTAGIVALMGPSGCGKTTLLRLIAGLTRPDSGNVYLPEDVIPSMVFQEDRLLPTLDARGNVMAALGENSEADRQWADLCLGRCGLSGEEARFPAELSGGMRRRVAIARAMAFGGGLLLLDEPFKGLDAELKKTVMNFVLCGEDSRQRLTLFVTHEDSEAAWADHILRLSAPPPVPPCG